MDLRIDPKEVEAILRIKVQEAIGSVLSQDPQKMIETVVTAALSAKKDTYSKETVFGEAVNAMIREAAKEAFKSWLAEQKPIILAAVLKRLKKERDGFAESIADKIVGGLAESFYVTTSLKVEG